MVFHHSTAWWLCSSLLASGLAVIETEASLVTRAPRLFIAADLAFGLHCAGTDLRRPYRLAGIGLIAMPTGILAAAFSDAFQTRRHLNDGK